MAASTSYAASGPYNFLHVQKDGKVEWICTPSLPVRTLMDDWSRNLHEKYGDKLDHVSTFEELKENFSKTKRDLKTIFSLPLEDRLKAMVVLTLKEQFKRFSRDVDEQIINSPIITINRAVEKLGRAKVIECIPSFARQPEVVEALRAVENFPTFAEYKYGPDEVYDRLPIGRDEIIDMVAEATEHSAPIPPGILAGKRMEAGLSPYL